MDSRFNQVEVILDKRGIERAVSRICYEILERNKGVEGLVLVGIRTAGVYLAERISRRIREIEGVEVPTGIIDVTLYRDNLSRGVQPRVRKTEIPFSLEGKQVILVDDVLFTGRTIRAALDAVIDFGRPIGIQLAVLIDRGHRELPIRADYVGRTISTSRDESVVADLMEGGGLDQVLLVKKDSRDGHNA